MSEYIKIRQVRHGTQVLITDHKASVWVVMSDEAVRALIRELQEAIGEAPLVHARFEEDGE